VLPEQLNARGGISTTPVVSIAEMERIDVPLLTTESIRHNPVAEIIGRRNLGPSTLSQVKELVL
jgi:hypothetical protein